MYLIEIFINLLYKLFLQLYFKWLKEGNLDNTGRAKAISPYGELDEELNAINTFIGAFSKKYDIPFEETINLLSKKRKQIQPTLIPSCILRDRKLGILECVTKYLKEEFKLSYHHIAMHLMRDDRVVWATYNRAIKKKKDSFGIKEPNVWLPVSIFSSNLGPLESISTYLHDNSKLSFNEIAKLLDRDNRTVWACYHTAKKKKVRK